jgi:hypothetical protein
MTTQAETVEARELRTMTGKDACEICYNILAEGFQTGVSASMIRWSPQRARAVALLIAHFQTTQHLVRTIAGERK